MSIRKPEFVKYIIPRVGKSYGPLYKFGKEFYLPVLVIVVYISFSTTLSMISLICILYHVWYYQFDPII